MWPFSSSCDHDYERVGEPRLPEGDYSYRRVALSVEDGQPYVRSYINVIADTKCAKCGDESLERLETKVFEVPLEEADA